jgi:hypothetical protein
MPLTRQACALLSLLLVSLVSLAVPPALAKTEQLKAVLSTRINGKTAKAGDPVRATLLQAATIDGVSFPKGSELTGTIVKAEKARRFIQAEVSPRRWLRPGGAISMEFTRITGGGKQAALSALPVGVGGARAKAKKDGTIEASSKGQVKSKLGRLGITGLSFVAAPVAPVVGGIAGAVKPDAVLPEAQDEKGRKHRRLKGLATGAIAGIPGGFLINDTVLKGRDIYIEPGTELLLQVGGGE